MRFIHAMAMHTNAHLSKTLVAGPKEQQASPVAGKPAQACEPPAVQPQEKQLLPTANFNTA